MVLKDKSLIKSGVASAGVHGFVLALGCLNIFEPSLYEDVFLNVEIAGASETQQILDDYNNHPEDFQPKLEEIQQKEFLHEYKQEEISEDQLVKGPSIVEPPLKLEHEITEESQGKGEALPPELKNEEILRLEKEKLEKEKAEKGKQEKLRREREEKRRLDEKRRKEKKKKEAERRRKRRLEAIKKLEKKKKAKKQRLTKIADAVKKSNESKRKTDDSFSNMLKSERNTWSSSSNGLGGNGNGLGSYGDGMGFVNSDAAIVSNQIIPHWVVASGVKNAETLIIRVRIKVKDNGEVPASSIEILDKDRYNSDSVFRSAADSARRAILKASPLKIPAEKMHLFRDFEINFNTDKALGVSR